MKQLDDIRSLILKAKEDRQRVIQDLLISHDTIITLKANIPGVNKRISEAYLLIKYFDNILNISGPKLLIDNDDGPCLIYMLDNQDASMLKDEMINIEDSNPWGRLIDIDIYTSKLKHSLSRKSLRKCLLCEKPAFVCQREKKHSTEELLTEIKRIIKLELTKIIDNIINQSIMMELNLEPKFGLVTPYSRGSHDDMDYSLMIKAKDAIKPYLIAMFFEGYSKTNLNEIFLEIRKIGQEAEDAMLKATSNINCYKGLIFNLGLAASSTGYILSNQLSFENIYEVIQSMTVNLTRELLQPPSTYGIRAYQEYKIGGARKEAEQGFPIVQKVLPNLKSLHREDLLKTLIEIIKLCEDTVLLKRSGSYEKYQYFKSLFDQMNNFNEEELNKITNECINQRVSFGGSADILIVVIYLKLFNNTFSLSFL